MYVSVPKALISTMQGFQTILVLNVCQCSKGTHQYHATVSNNISTQCMSVFQRHSLVPCKGFKQYQYSMYVSVPKALISNMHGFQTILVLNVCQYSNRTYQHHARLSNHISTQCMSVFQSHSFETFKGFKQYQYSMYVSVPKALISNMLGFQPIFVLNVCQCSKGTHQYHARVSNNISTQCMSVFQRQSLAPCNGFKQDWYSMYASVPKGLISTMEGFQAILVLNVCQCSKGTHQYHARVSTNICTQCMSVFQRHSLIPCKGFNQYQYSMYVSVPKAIISTMQWFQTKLVLNVCQCSKGTHQYHARVSSNISTQCMSVFQRHSLVTCQGFNQYLYSMYVSVPKALINTMQGFQPILVRNVCQYSKGTHQHHASVSNNISTQCMSVFQRHSLVPCRGFKQYQYSMYVSVPKTPISTMQRFQTILVLNVCQCSKGTHQYHARVLNNISTQCMSVFQRHSLVTCMGFKQYQYSMYVSIPTAHHQHHARLSNNISTQCMSVFQSHSFETFKGFKQYQYSMYVSVPKALISNMLGFQPIFVLNVCQCSEGTHQYHAGVSNNISTQCMPVFQRHSLVPCRGFKQYQYSMYVSVPKALISTMQGFQTILLLNVCQCSKGTHQYHARVSNNISTQCMSVFQRQLVTCKGFKQYQYSMYVSVPKALISTMQGFQTILVLNVCQCSKDTLLKHSRVSNNISTQCMSVFQRHSLLTCQGLPCTQCGRSNN